MKNRFLVRSEHLNHQGHLFGGDLMAEIDNIGFCMVRETYPSLVFVTRAADIAFERPARLGDIIVFSAHVERVGTTSITVGITGEVMGERISTASVTYVNVGPDGCKAPIPRS